MSREHLARAPQWELSDFEPCAGAVMREINLTDASGRPRSAIVVTPPDAVGPRSCVILGHDLGGNRRALKYLDLAAEYALREGWAVAVMDGPFHGNRRPAALDGLEEGPERFALMRAQMAVPGRSETMAADWSALIDVLSKLPDIGAGTYAFEGVSMSSLYGVTFVAREPRIVAAVFHAVGIRTGADADAAGAELGGDQFIDRVREIGSRPVQLLAQANDELFPRKSSYLFFDTLLSPESELIVVPGTHRQPPEAPVAGREYAAAFLRRYLPSGR